jgi:hypothetical protein
MNKIRKLLVVMGLLLLCSCSALQPASPDQSTPGPDSSLSESLTASIEPPRGLGAAVLNSVYQLGLSDQARTVQLVDGRYQQGERDDPDFLFVSVTDYISVGDLDDDGIEEAVALITENYGGTGSFVFLTVYRKEGDMPWYLTSIFLDDRPILEGLSIAAGKIRVAAIVHDVDDPMCCPSLSTERHFRLYGNNLVMSDFSSLTPTGQPRAITIDSPADGAEASGIVQVTGRISIAPFENTLVYRIFDMGGVELSAGPVMVEAADLGTPGTFQKAIDLGNILNNTTVRIEVQDIDAVDGSLFAMDSILIQVK